MRKLLLLAFAVPLFAQQPEGPPPPRREMPAPKNLQILKPGPDLIPTMRGFTASLGVRCDFCHVQGDFSSDDKHDKLIARMMIKMTADINGKFPDGQTHVGCFTCHRGSTEPALNPPAGEHQEHPAPPPPSQ